MSTVPALINAGDQDAVSLIEISAIQPIEATLPEQYELEVQGRLDILGGHDLGPASAFVQGILADAITCLDQAVGLYALYQYPVVWEPITTCPLLAFADLKGPTLRNVTPMKPDNSIPFRLNAKTKIQNGHLVDRALENLHLLANGDLHIPLVLLQRALWQKNIQVRFLENFLVIEHLAGHFAGEDLDRGAREEFYATVNQFIQRECPQHLDRLGRLKGVFIQAPLRQRLEDYFIHLGIHQDCGLIGRMLKLRNDLAHGGEIDPGALSSIEVDTRLVARQVMEKELALRGVHYCS